MNSMPKPWEIYRHFKGNLYQVITLAKDAGTLEDVVVYQALYGDFQVYVRPLTEFMSLADGEKYPESAGKPRFEKQKGKAAPAGEDAADAKAAEAEAADAKAADVKAVGAKTAAEKDELQTPQEEVQTQPELDPMVLAFLEADSYGEKLNLLAGMRHKITNDMITTMAIASDIEIEEGELSARYENLKNCLLTKEKYECRRI